MVNVDPSKGHLPFSGTELGSKVQHKQTRLGRPPGSGSCAVCQTKFRSTLSHVKRDVRCAPVVASVAWTRAPANRPQERVHSAPQDPGPISQLSTSTAHLQVGGSPLLRSDFPPSLQFAAPLQEFKKEQLLTKSMTRDSRVEAYKKDRQQYIRECRTRARCVLRT